MLRSNSTMYFSKKRNKVSNFLYRLFITRKKSLFWAMLLTFKRIWKKEGSQPPPPLKAYFEFRRWNTVEFLMTSLSLQPEMACLIKEEVSWYFLLLLLLLLSDVGLKWAATDESLNLSKTVDTVFAHCLFFFLLPYPEHVPYLPCHWNHQAY